MCREGWLTPTVFLSRRYLVGVRGSKSRALHTAKLAGHDAAWGLLGFSEQSPDRIRLRGSRGV